ncbi:MAG: NPCBM/NEW2 domain-containing protein [Thermoguttaceae bacterium]
MSDNPVKLPAADSELARLVEAMCDGTITPDEGQRLESLLAGDRNAQLFYVAYLDLHAQMQWMTRDQESELCEKTPDELSADEGELPSLDCWDCGSLIPPIITESSSTIHPPLATFRSSLGGWLTSYAAATVITAVAILGAWMYRIAHEGRVAKTPSPSIAVQSPGPMPKPFGRISGLADCQWRDPVTAPASDTEPFFRGRKYVLDSGLMEITYDSGAKVILQGPCVYEVDSADSGFLARGRLTARVASEASSRLKTEPLAANRSSLPARFTVRTPTATVTDLGTEFGVDVDASGATRSHVFRGLVSVRLAGDDRPNRQTLLRENDSVRVDRDESTGKPRFAPSQVEDRPAFVRRMARPDGVLDLLDIVAGGNGLGQRRELGIDPFAGGRVTAFTAEERHGAGRYLPIGWRPFVDGVFIPDGGRKAVQLDFAGHTFDAFPHTCGSTVGSVWARAAAVPNNLKGNGDLWIYALGGGEQFMPDHRGLLALHPNVGITFNLVAMRQAYRDVTPTAFRGAVGIADARPQHPEADPMADVWIFVDGRLRVGPTRLRPAENPRRVDVPLGPHDRFLTLVATDAANGNEYDWVVFGDPVLDTAPSRSDQSNRKAHETHRTEAP